MVTLVKSQINLLSCILLGLLSIPPEGIAQNSQQKKVALVIGVQNYTALPPLRNSLNDAASMSLSLKAKGFSVETLYDPRTKKELREAITRYYNQMHEAVGAIGVIFYAGHGMQYEGENYLIPVSCSLQDPGDLEEQCVKMNTVMAVLKSSGKSLNILLLDACRSLPSFTRSADQGLSRMEAPQGTIIVFATQPGRVASDGTGKNGLFTSKFLKAIDQPNLNISEVLKKVKQEVYAESKESQLPSVEDNSLGGDFYFTMTSQSIVGSKNEVGASQDNMQQPARESESGVGMETVDFGYGIGKIKSIVIGSQQWIVRNLNVDTFADSSPIPEAKSIDEWKMAQKKKMPAWCNYGNDPGSGNTYGKLYNWYAVTDVRGLCPIGWHVPSDEEWTGLFDPLGPEAGRQLKSLTAWNQNGNGTDALGFSATPGGYRSYDGAFYGLGNESAWWSSTGSSSNTAWNRSIRYRSVEVFRASFDKENGYSVRCLKTQ